MRPLQGQSRPTRKRLSWQRAEPSWPTRKGLPTAICRTEYEKHPRGRIVYERSADLFVIYADPRLPIAKTISLTLRHSD